MIARTSLHCVIEAMDMRKGVDGLSTWLSIHLGRAPQSGEAFIFSNRAHTRIKLVVWDGNGVWLCLRRLHKGSFVWPRAGDGTFELSNAQWQWLISGIDWQRMDAQLTQNYQF